MDKKLLDIVIFNKFFVHCWYSTFTDIALLNKSYWGWVVDNSFDYSYNPDGELDTFNWIFSWFYCHRTDNLFEDIAPIIKASFAEHKGKIKDLAISRLEKGEYIFVLCDTYFQPGHYQYKKEHYQHFVLLFGYDDREKVFHAITDWREKNRFEKFVINYNSMEKSKTTTERHKLKNEVFQKNLAIIEVNNFHDKQYDYRFDPQRILKNIKVMIEGSKKGNCYSGLSALRIFSQDLEELFAACKAGNRGTMARGMSSAFQLAYFNQVRNMYLIRYIYKQGCLCIGSYEALKDKIQLLKKKWGILQMLAIKYYIHSQADTLNSITRRLFDTWQEEEHTYLLLESSIHNYSPEF